MRLANNALRGVPLKWSNDGDAIWLDAGTTRVLDAIPGSATASDNRHQRVARSVATGRTEHTFTRCARLFWLGGRIGTDGFVYGGTGNEQLLDMVNIRTAFISGVGFYA